MLSLLWHLLPIIAVRILHDRLSRDAGIPLTGRSSAMFKAIKGSLDDIAGLITDGVSPDRSDSPAVVHADDRVSLDLDEDEKEELRRLESMGEEGLVWHAWVISRYLLSVICLAAIATLIPRCRW